MDRFLLLFFRRTACRRPKSDYRQHGRHNCPCKRSFSYISKVLDIIEI